ncbi:transcription factor FER-LIKE IRON DEFICIENCY-INDUCED TRANSCRIPTION FACTOR [Melia azedarach]|uniref:Transcription factor FER-LIKE IRON DEFICIENCY-INDUCED TRANSCRIPTION FACTOR n=1 Tax=Melia azedarach TaxID=155640 RepID=A0ACC1YPQ7_MELAZ|nr:transcription factor FER-LIKE IRON DEFICIENCY-INDUCED TRANSCRIPTION FACTOR [Melia azedarach]
MDAFGYPMMQNNEYELHDFIDDPSFDQFVDLIRGENEDPVPGFDCKLNSGCGVDNQFGSNTEDRFDFDSANTMVSDLTFVLNSSFSSCLNGGENGRGGDQEEDDDGEDSSGATKKRSSKKSKTDRSRTLISERKRRGRMKEKLYALRALVPNITKMDKASIVGDAVLYVQELQMKAKKLKAEIAGLEASLAGAERYPKKTQVRSNNYPTRKQIMQMDLFQVEEGGYYLRLVCNKGAGVAVSLYKALESFTGFSVRNSNLATISERFVLSFTLNVRDSEESMHLANLRLWVTNALLNQGFEMLTPLSA